MLEHISFGLSHGYLSKSILAENRIEMDQEIVNRILLELSSLDGDKIECYHGCMTSGWTDGEKVDYLILYKIDDGYKPILIKNGLHQYSMPYELFEKYYEDDVSDKEYDKKLNITECDESERTELKKNKKI